MKPLEDLSFKRPPAGKRGDNKCPPGTRQPSEQCRLSIEVV